MPNGNDNSFDWRNILSHVCALAVAGMFLYAGGEKIIEPRQFAIDIGNYRMLPEAYHNLMAIFLPWIEVGAAIALIIPATRRGGAILITGMLLMFIAAVSYAAFYMGYNINCGCFGKNSASAGLKTVLLDVALLMGVLLAVWPWKKQPDASVVAAEAGQPA